MSTDAILRSSVPPRYCVLSHSVRALGFGLVGAGERGRPGVPLFCS